MVIEVAIYVTILVSATLLIYLICLGLGIQGALKRILTYAGDRHSPKTPIAEPSASSDSVPDADNDSDSTDDFGGQHVSSGSSNSKTAEHRPSDSRISENTKDAPVEAEMMV